MNDGSHIWKNWVSLFCTSVLSRCSDCALYKGSTAKGVPGTSWLYRNADESTQVDTRIMESWSRGQGPPTEPNMATHTLTPIYSQTHTRADRCAQFQLGSRHPPRLLFLPACCSRRPDLASNLTWVPRLQCGGNLCCWWRGDHVLGTHK